MKVSGTILFTLCWLVSIGQITTNVNVIDPKALPLTDAVVSKILKKDWYVHQILDVKRRDTTQQNWGSRHFYLNEDGSIKNSSSRWVNVANHHIEIQTELPNFFSGAFAVYEANDSSLVLTKVLTSSGDWTRTIKFKSYEQTDQSTFAPHRSNEPNEGETITYHPNGRIATIEQWNAVTKRPTREELFLNKQLPNPRFPDSSYGAMERTGLWATYFEDGRLKWTCDYDNGGLWKEYYYNPSITFIKTSNSGRGYFIGGIDSLWFGSLTTAVLDRAGSRTDVKISLVNLSSQPIAVTVLSNNNLKIEQATYTLQPHPEFLPDKSPPDSITFPCTTPPSVKSEEVFMEIRGVRVPTQVLTRGYHLTNADFKSRLPIVIPGTFIIHRIGPEFEVEITNTKTKKTMVLPVSQNFGEYSLKQGTYDFVLRSPVEKATKRIRIEN